MTALRALIVDDERLARAELRRLLTAHPGIEVVGDAADADQARAALDDLEPDLLFLDVQMPGETGFDLLESLDPVPLVVFTTAYDEYALRAFEVSAIDYLVKPIDPRRLERTVERLLTTRSTDTTDSAGRREDSGNDATGHGGPLSVGPSRADRAARRLTAHDQVFVRDGERCWLVYLGQIRLFESEGNSTRIFFADESPLMTRSLQQLSDRLDPRTFFRANRNQIMNLKAIRSIHTWFGGRLMARLEGGHEVTLSRRRARAFREHMSV
jgi:two-component system LytT family response regulator